MVRIALTAFRRNPKLASCDPRSVFAAVLMSAQLGWEIGMGGHCYLIPYKRECQLVPGWLGLVDLVYRSGRAAVWTGAVFEGDEFNYVLGDAPTITHRPGTAVTEKLTHVYAVGRMNGVPWPIVEVWPVGKVIAHRDRYNKVGKEHYSYEHFEMYARKVALMQVLKYMPKSAELQQAIELDTSAGSNTQDITIADAVDLTYSSEVVDQEKPEKPEAAGVAGLKEQITNRKGEIWPKEPPKDAA